jgi:hypothetical protein
MQICNKRTCKFPMSDNRGLGMGRDGAKLMFGHRLESKAVQNASQVLVGN